MEWCGEGVLRMDPLVAMVVVAGSILPDKIARQDDVVTKTFRVNLVREFQEDDFGINAFLVKTWPYWKQLVQAGGCRKLLA